MKFSLSSPGRDFLAGHEGFVSKAYRCPAGVLTIGYGFTMGSKVFASYWRSKKGRALQMGDAITRSEADALLIKAFDDEYGAAVNSRIAPKRQNHYDGAGSMTFNCGTGALSWKWAQALKAGNIAECARLMRTTATTANGRRLAGLVRRRDEEATLVETGKYVSHGSSATPANPPSTSESQEAIREYQGWLLKLGYDLGPAGADGVAGTKTKTAVRAFQKKHDLKIDGIVGPATRAAFIRALDAKNTNNATAGSGAAGGAAGAGSDVVTSSPQAPADAITPDLAISALGWGLAAAAIVFVAFIIYRNRGRFTQQRVPT